MAIVCAHDEFAAAKRWAELYRARGFNVLPSRLDEKRPIGRYAQWWDTPAPADLFDKHPSTNLQVMCGRRWRLLVIDLDGPEAREIFRQWGPCPQTWVTHSGGDGQHLWFRLPANYRRELPKAVLWEGDDKHSAIERLCDRSLIMAPPSVHPKTGKRYLFASKRESPACLKMPAPCPSWILARKPLEREKPSSVPYVPPAPSTNLFPIQGRYRAADVLEAIPNKLAVAREWGLRIASERASHAGWCPCHAINREDRTPSAAISVTTGRYWEPGQQTLSLFELGERLGRYLDWRDAVNDLGRLYHAQEVA